MNKVSATKEIRVGNDADTNDNEKHSELTTAITSGGMPVSKLISIPFRSTEC